MSIRRANPTDGEAIAMLAKELGYAPSGEDMMRRLETLEGQQEHAVFVAEDDDNSVVGWLHIFGRRLLLSEPIAEIGGIVVSQACRRRGIGRELISAAEQWARRKGFGGLVARSDTRRPESHDFYPKIGMTKLKTQSIRHFPDTVRPTPPPGHSNTIMRHIRFS